MASHDGGCRDQKQRASNEWGERSEAGRESNCTNEHGYGAWHGGGAGTKNRDRAISGASEAKPAKKATARMSTGMGPGTAGVQGPKTESVQ